MRELAEVFLLVGKGKVNHWSGAPYVVA